jgi:SAM-dependent methyltransferase
MLDPPPKLDDEALALFARKGLEAGAGAPQVGEGNAVKVRRVMQLTQDMAGRPFEGLTVLDLGCGEGVYAIEAGLRGAQVLALDARTQRMNAGAECAARHGLTNVVFRQEDVRDVSRQTHGSFDVVYCLGLLYHLDGPEVLPFIEGLRDLCAGLLVVDTLISLDGEQEVVHDGRTYRGASHREHDDDDSATQREARVLRSVGNTFSFRLTRDSLVGALSAAGFATVQECLAPPEPEKAPDRVTLAALGADRVSIASYPWLNDE